MKHTTLSLIFLILGLAACSSPLPEHATWDGSVRLSDDRELPFTMSLDFRESRPSGFFLVGDERTVIPEIIVQGSTVRLIISEYSSELRGEWNGATLTGKYFRYRADTTFLPFAASPRTESTPPAQAEVPLSTIRLVGKYQVYFYRDGKTDSSATAVFRVKGDSAFGTFVEPSGDYGLLAGVQKGDSVLLNRFTGWQALRLEIGLSEGVWKGNYFVRDLAPRPFSLKPLSSASHRSTLNRQTTTRVPDRPFEFEGMTVDGDILSSQDPRFKGKVILVDIMGTWCHNCLDAAPLLQQLYSDYRDQGLEVIGLSFELSDDPDLARKNISLYTERHGIEFPILFSGDIGQENVTEKLRSQLDGFFAYPTTLFVGRDQLVKEIHVGFTGPATGEEYQRQIEDYFAIVRRLLSAGAAEGKR